MQIISFDYGTKKIGVAVGQTQTKTASPLNVIFNKKTFVASSQDNAKFISDNTSIDSAGFDIIENGNIINFKGKTKLVLK